MPDKLGQPLLADFDWAAHGISHPYLIFMTGRCGSTWLTSLLRDTRLAGNPMELFNEQIAKRECHGTEGLENYFIALAKRETSHGRFGVEIDAARLSQIESLIDWPSVFPKASTSSFFLYRNNLPAQAWSWVSARKSGLWHVRLNAKQPTDPVSGAMPTETELIREMVRIRKDEEFLQEFFGRHGYQPYYLDYETLVTELDTEIRTMLRILSVSREDMPQELVATNKSSVAKIRYTEKDAALSEFNAKHACANARLRISRFQVSAEELLDLFAG